MSAPAASGSAGAPASVSCTRAPAASGSGRQRGQASVELVGGLPAVVLVAFVIFQLLAVGYSAVLAGTAAEAGALALADGADPREAARDAVPGWSRAGLRVRVARGAVEISLRPPSPVRALARRLEVRSTAAVEEP